MAIAYIALGSNLGDRKANLDAALAALSADGNIRVVRCSSFHETEPVGGPPGQGKYLNAAAELDTSLSPRELLNRMLAIESRLGRVRSVPNAPRTIDLDLLLYDQEVINEPGLIVPHPRMWGRPFVMKPLAELLSPAQLLDLRGAAPGTEDSTDCATPLRTDPGGWIAAAFIGALGSVLAFVLEPNLWRPSGVFWMCAVAGAAVNFAVLAGSVLGLLRVSARSSHRLAWGLALAVSSIYLCVWFGGMRIILQLMRGD